MRWTSTPKTKILRGRLLRGRQVCEKLMSENLSHIVKRDILLECWSFFTHSTLCIKYTVLTKLTWLQRKKIDFQQGIRRESYFLFYSVRWPSLVQVVWPLFILVILTNNNIKLQFCVQLVLYTYRIQTPLKLCCNCSNVVTNVINLSLVMSLYQVQRGITRTSVRPVS